MSLTLVSLFDVLKAVALKVSLSDEEIDHYTEAPLEENDFMKNLARLPARSCFRYSRAAKSLLDLLFAQYSETKWYDVIDVGLVLQSDRAREEAYEILRDFSRGESLFKEQVRLNEKAPTRFASKQTEKPNHPGASTRPRSFEIRLDKNLLIEILDTEKIPYNPDLLLDTYLGYVKATKAPTKPGSSTRTYPARKKRKYIFRGVYKDALSYAMENATDNTDYMAVWTALCELVVSPFARQYDIKHADFSKGVCFIDVKRKDDKDFILTRENVREIVDRWVKNHGTHLTLQK